MTVTIPTVPPDSREYARDYENGWRVSERCSDGALDRADQRGVSHAWYDGYMDCAVGREKWSYRKCRLAGFDSIDVYLASLG